MTNDREETRRRGDRRAGVGWSAARLALAIAAGVLSGLPAPAAAQDLADLDYEHLEFRGIGFDAGYLFPTRVEQTESYSIRLDLGYLGPGLRIVPSFTYWSSPFQASEVNTLEDRVADLVSRQTGSLPPSVNLGTIEWTNYSLGLDAHVVWAVPLNVLTFAGLGVSGHVLDGSGSAIEGTFIEDLLDSVSAGFNLHLGLEYPITDRFRIQSQGRYEIIEDMQYFQIRLGGHFLWGNLVPGEEKR
jgi:opacity protein-like surface antigen